MGSMLASHHLDGFMGGHWMWFWPIALVVQLAFWGIVIWLVVRFARPWIRARQPKGPERILAERFAEGAIGEEEYHQRLKVLRRGLET